MTQLSNTEILGNFIDQLPNSEEYLTIHFSPSAEARKRRWNNYGLSADFLGDYFANFFPGDEIPGSLIDRRDTIKAAVSFIANELIENAMKYSEKSIHFPVSISLYLYDQKIVFMISNYTSDRHLEQYQQFITELLASDLEEFYTKQLEKTATGEIGQSRMGILTIINDYSAQLGWKFSRLEQNPQITQVTVMAHLEI